MLRDWARFAGFFAFATFALVGSLLWALNYPPQDAEWTCKTETASHQPNHNRVRILSCRKPQPAKLQNESANAEGKSNSNASEEIKVTDKLLVLFTAFLVFVGCFQAFYLWGTLKATAVAAKAADLSAKAAVALELPIIRAEPIGFGLGIAQNESGERFENFGLQCFEFTNRGRTEAYPIELHWGWIVTDKLPNTPEYKLSKSFDLKTTLNEAEGTIALYVREFDMGLSQGDTEKITNRDPTLQVRLHLYCRLTYEDFMYERRTIRFCWKYFDLFAGGKFIADATPAYNQRTP